MQLTPSSSVFQVILVSYPMFISANNIGRYYCLGQLIPDVMPSKNQGD